MAAKSIEAERLSNALFALFDETFEIHHGIYLNKGTSFFETLDTITAAQASKPIGGKSASIAAQVAHVTFYLDVLERYMLGEDSGEVDWSEIWRTVSEVTPDQWNGIQSALKQTHGRIRAALRNLDSWDREETLGGALAMVVHTAYHLGGIRQALCTLR